jgi:hypothetical protein
MINLSKFIIIYIVIRENNAEKATKIWKYFGQTTGSFWLTHKESLHLLTSSNAQTHIKKDRKTHL